ncbi:hypothetical protein MJ579_25455 [Klebsiella pneumoniae]|nr:hypothetical protein MJ579_25455 [Klebsiella pneumoniae]
MKEGDNFVVLSGHPSVTEAITGDMDFALWVLATVSLRCRWRMHRCITKEIMQVALNQAKGAPAHPA